MISLRRFNSVLLVVVLLVLAACATPVDELAFSGTIPDEYGYSEDIVYEYSERLANRLGYGSARFVSVIN